MTSLLLKTTNSIDIFSNFVSSKLEIPLLSLGISAGFPSPANDFIDISIDLNRDLIKHPSATFFGRVKGESMKDIGIGDGDLLIIDKSLSPTNGKVAVCFIDGDFTVKRIKLENNKCWLMPANVNYHPIEINEQNDLQIWGIVIHVIKSF
jgi:DNA polymerase V